MVTNILKFLLFISPLAYSHTINKLNLELILFYCSGILLFIGTFFDDKKRGFIGIYGITGLLIICLINLFLMNFDPRILNGIIQIFFGVFILKIIVEYAENNIETYLPFLIIPLFINIYIYALQNNGIDFIFYNSYETKGYHGAALITLPRFTTYISITAPLCLYYSKTLFFLLTGFAFAKYDEPQLILIISGILILICLLNKTFKGITLLYIYLTIAILAFLSFVYIFKYQIGFWEQLCKKFSIRFEILKSILFYTFQNPITGTGINIIPEIENSLYKDYTVCSSVFQFCMFTGVLGITWFIYSISQFIKIFSNELTCLATLNLIVVCIFEYPLEIRALSMSILFILGMCMIKNYTKIYNDKGVF